MARKAVTYEDVAKGDRKNLVARDPSPLHERMKAYLDYRTGYDNDLKTVQIVRVLLTDFQASPEEKAIREAAKEAKEQELEAPKPATRSRGRKPAAAKDNAKPASRSRGRGKAKDETPAPRRSRARKPANDNPPADDTGEQEPF
jgi:hypothetical protein